MKPSKKNNGGGAPSSESVKTFGKNLRRYRQLIHLSQQELAKTTDLSQSFISDVETGKQAVNLFNAEKLARAVNVPLWRLLRPVD